VPILGRLYLSQDKVADVEGLWQYVSLVAAPQRLLVLGRLLEGNFPCPL